MVSARSVYGVSFVALVVSVVVLWIGMRVHGARSWTDGLNLSPAEIAVLSRAWQPPDGCVVRSVRVLKRAVKTKEISRLSFFEVNCEFNRSGSEDSHIRIWVAIDALDMEAVSGHIYEEFACGVICLGRVPVSDDVSIDSALSQISESIDFVDGWNSGWHRKVGVQKWWVSISERGGRYVYMEIATDGCGNALQYRSASCPVGEAPEGMLAHKKGF